MVNDIKVGFGKTMIKFPNSELPLREFNAKLDDLYCRVMILQGDSRFVLVSFDMTSLRTAVIKQYRELVARKLGVSTEQVWITVTHTFSAPHLPSSIETSERKLAFQTINQKLRAAMTQACDLAMEDCQKVQLGVTSIDCPINVNRNVKTNAGWWLGRNLDGYANHQLRVWAFRKADQQTNLIVNYDIQQSVLDHVTSSDNQRFISSDLMGASLAEYEQASQVAIFLPGAAGDQRPLLVAQDDQSADVMRTLVKSQAEVITERLHAAVNKIKQWSPLLTLRLETLTMRVPTQAPSVTTFEIKPTKQYTFAPTGETTKLQLYVLQLNEYLLVGTEPELNSSFGGLCRNQLHTAKTTMIATLVNGAAKYLPEDRDFDRITYQAMNTHLGRGSDQIMLKGFAQLRTKTLKEESSC